MSFKKQVGNYWWEAEGGSFWHSI